VLAVVVVVGGGLAAVKLLGGSGGELAGGGKLASAVTSEPEEAWTFDTDGEYASVTSSGDTTVLTLGESGELVALDKDGEEIWSTGDGGSYGYGYVLDDEDLVLVQGYEDYGIGALSLEDGDELWFDDDGGSAYGMVDGGLVVNTYDEDDSLSDVAVVDPETGDEKWSVADVDSTAITKDAVYVVKDEELVRLASSSGDEEWSVDLSLGVDEYPSVTAVEELVVVSTDEVQAFSPDGDELWTEQADSADGSIYASAYAADAVYVNESDYSEDETDETITVFDTEGEVGELDIDEDESFYGYGFESGGTSYFLNQGDGSLYGDDLERVERYDGVVAAADSGLYSLDGDQLRYYEYGESSASWQLDVDSGEDEPSVYAGDGVVYTLIDGTVTAYR
jgi:hypothetical protein